VAQTASATVALSAPLGTLGAWISRGRLAGTDEETRSGAKKVSLSPAARRILLRLPVNRQPYTRTLPGLGEYRLIAIPGQDADVHITGLPLAELNSTTTRLERIETVVFGTVLLVTGLAVFGVVRLSLRPLRKVTTRLEPGPIGPGMAPRICSISSN
jgi:two-component system, OmpR family, sensor kinase